MAPLNDPYWLPDGDSFCYLEGSRLVRVLPATGEITREEFADGDHGLRLDPQSGRLADASEQVITARTLGLGALAGDPPVTEILSPDRRLALGVSGHDLCLRHTHDDRVEPLTGTGTADLPWVSGGAAWSPDGTLIAVVRLDLRGVRRMPVVHWLGPWEEIDWVPYTRTGGPLPQMLPHVIHTGDGTARPVDVGPEPDQYVAFLGFHGGRLRLVTINRARNRLRYYAADPDGRSDLLLEERVGSFLPSAFGLAADAVVPLPSGRFILRSERSGLAGLYLYSADGGTCTPLTGKLGLPVAGIDLDYEPMTPETPAQGVVAVDEAADTLYFKAAADDRRPYDTHLYRVGLDGGGLRRLTGGDGVHDITFSPSRRFYIDVHSSTGQPPVARLHTAEGALVAVLREDPPDPGWRPPEEFTATAADGRTTLHGLVYLPSDFDPAASYPVVDLLYGGPQETWVPRRWAQTRTPLVHELTGLGFVCVVVDARGTPGRGKEFHDVVHRRFGRHEIPDHVAAIGQAAATRPYMDLDRVGVFGHSWGGYMTIRAMLTAPDFYHAGVAGMPVADLDDHLAMAIEPYMSLPKDNSEGYRAASNLGLVGDLRGRLCVIAGTSDVNAPFSATVKLIDALVRAGKRYDLVLMPEVDHHPRGAARAYYERAVTTFLHEQLNSERRKA
ncbi:hypothetical protein DP939_15915 [Spongiactinospora rosea]|uniref:Dipeptidyl aminopeptidase/acylaminoacyl peptidase n=1 Tax=Spongiactinospora rosea TaxID=2248750 RepID=A0A366M1U4_9ACTN|nr:prolyl oligopeptidase family serine peptidase [Spongiactinospora rosea]RBQ19402.1 hypothetical protein DP939_15915 [Spongiactinospora rosea]